MYNYSKRRGMITVLKWFFPIWMSFGSFLIIKANDSDGSCYKFFAYKNLTWNESQKKCSKDGGNLVSMETEREWDFVNQHIQERHFSNNKNEWFIGLRNYSGTWKWTSNKVLNISKWQTKAQEPNGDGQCAVMAKNFPEGTQGLFKDVPCRIRYIFICEYDERNPICEDLSLHCCNNQSIYKPSPTVKYSTTIVTTNGSAVMVNNSRSTRTTYIIATSVFGLLLASCTVVYIYIFCWKHYKPGYQGYKKENEANTEKQKLCSSSGDNESCSRSDTLEFALEDSQDEVETMTMKPLDQNLKHEQMKQISDDGHPDNESCDQSVIHRQDIQQDEQNDDENESKTVLYAQVHKLNPKTLPVQNEHPSSEVDQQEEHVQDSQNGSVVYATVHKKTTKEAASRKENVDFNFPPLTTDHLESSSACALEEAKATNNDTVDNAPIDTAATVTVAMETVAEDTGALETIAKDTVALETGAEDAAAMETISEDAGAKETFQRHNTWANSSLTETGVEIQSPDEEKSYPQSVADTSSGNEVIYASVMKSKPKPRPRTNTDKVVYAKVNKIHKLK